MTRIFQPKGPKRFAHQERGLRKMIETGGRTALLFDPGLGKTATTLDYCSLLALKSQTGEARVLVVCPLAAIDTWVQQAAVYVADGVDVWAEALGGSIAQRGEAMAARGGQPYGKAVSSRHHPRALHYGLSIDRTIRSERVPAVTPSEGPDGLSQPRLVLLVTNIDSFASRRPRGSSTMADYMVESVRRFNPDLVVVDESHRLKSPTGNSSRCLARLTPFVKRRVILTGTVMPSGPLDVFGQWRFLDPYAFGNPQRDGTVRQATFGAFRERFALMGGYMGREVTGYRNIDDLQAIMAKNACVARKADSLDLPPTLDVVVPVVLSAQEKTAYREMREMLATQLQTGALATVPNRLAQMMRLRQITSGYLPDDNGAITAIGASKVKVIESLVHDTLAGEHRIVVFAVFTHEIAMLKAALSKHGTKVMVIQGSTPSKDRIEMRRRFGSSDPARIVMIAQIKTMSLAVNELVTANHAIFGSLSQQRDDIEQAKARLDRQGQTRPVTFWFAAAPGTIDSVILQSHRDKTDLETACLKHIQEKGEGEE